MEGETSDFTDLTSIFSDIFPEDSFSSFEQFEALFNKFQEDTGSVSRVKSSSSAEFENKRRQHPIPKELKYGSVTYVCVHYGSPKKKGLGLRKKQRYLACGCNVSLSLSARKKTPSYNEGTHEA